MNVNVRLVPIKNIKQHEQLLFKNLRKVKAQIIKTKLFKVPIIIDKKTLIVLDGHHRLNSCKQIGLNKIPCILVDYFNDSKIKVVSRRKNFIVNKKIVVERGLNNQLFPPKTTKHSIPYRVRNLKIPLLLLN